MEKSKTEFCPAVWFSGFFALGAIVHLLRLISGFSLSLGGMDIPLEASGRIALLFGVLSIGLLALGLKKPCGKNKTKGMVCCK